MNPQNREFRESGRQTPSAPLTSKMPVVLDILASIEDNSPHTVPLPASGEIGRCEVDQTDKKVSCVSAA